MMLPNDRRDRDRITKLLKRRPVVVDPLAPPKPTTPELMQKLTDSFTSEYAEGEQTRADSARAFNDVDRKGKT